MRAQEEFERGGTALSTPYKQISSLAIETILGVISPPQLNFPIAHAHGERWLGIDRRAIDHAAVTHMESRSVPGTRHDPIFTRPFIQRASQVGTNSANGVN